MTTEHALAINGGRPVRSTPMPARQAIGATEEAMVAECLAYYRTREADICYQGPFEERYCQAFAEFQGGGFADAVATGTAAVYVALAALSLPAGSEVLVSPITDPGTISAIILRQLVPRLMDSMPDNFNVGPEQFVARLGRDVRAAIVVHAAGQAAPIDQIVDAARANGVLVIEDCSQSHGALFDGKPVGTFGNIAAFSTMYRKTHVTGASGGVVYTRDESLHRAALAHADRGKPRWLDGFDERDPAGFLFPALNLHTDEISCAIGLASLRRLPMTIRARRAFVGGIAAGLRASTVCDPYAAGPCDSPFIYPVRTKNLPLDAKMWFARAVRAEGIGLNPHYNYLVEDWPWIKPFLADDFQTRNARAVRDASFCLYLNENYGAPEIADTLAAIAKVEEVFLGAMSSQSNAPHPRATNEH